MPVFPSPVRQMRRGGVEDEVAHQNLVSKLHF